MRLFGFFTALGLLVALPAGAMAQVGPYEGHGYIFSAANGECGYTQIVRQRKYLFNFGTSLEHIITLDSPRCLLATDDNILTFELNFSRLISQPWVKFDFRTKARLHGKFVAHGYCVPATNSPVALLIDVAIKGAYIARVIYTDTDKQLCE